MNNNVNSSFPDFEEFVSSFKSNNSDTSNDNCTNSFNNSSGTNSEFGDSFEQNNPFGNIDMNTILKIKQVMEKMNNNKNNPRSNLLLSLKPYLKPSRKQKVDQYIQLLNMGSIMENFGQMGGEKMK